MVLPGYRRFHTIMRITAALHFIVVLAGSCRAATVLAEHVLPETASGWYSVGAGMGTDGRVYDNRQAQTFTATSLGYLVSISFNAYRFSTTNADLRVSVTTVVAGQPAAVLASILVSPAAVAMQSPTLDFMRGGGFSNTAVSTGHLLLEENTRYALVFQSDSVEANYRLIGDYTGYAGGANLSFQNTGSFGSSSGDLLFRVLVAPVPEPQSPVLLAIGGLTLVWRRTRRTRNKRYQTPP